MFSHKTTFSFFNNITIYELADIHHHVSTLTQILECTVYMYINPGIKTTKFVLYFCKTNTTKIQNTTKYVHVHFVII